MCSRLHKSTYCFKIVNYGTVTFFENTLLFALLHMDANLSIACITGKIVQYTEILTITEHIQNFFVFMNTRK